MVVEDADDALVGVARQAAVGVVGVLLRVLNALSWKSPAKLLGVKYTSNTETIS